MANMQVLIEEYEESIETVSVQIAKLESTLPTLTGKDLEVTHRKIKIYGSMIEDMMLAIYQMRQYLE